MSLLRSEFAQRRCPSSAAQSRPTRLRLRQAVASRTHGARRDPAPCECDKGPVRHRGCRSRSAVRVDSRRPGPDHERCLEMRYQLGGLQGSLSRIEQHPAELGRCESFPRHRARRQMPVGGTRHARGRLVRALVTGATPQAHRTVIIRPARDIHDVSMPVIALSREIGVRVAVHAARVLQHRQHPLEERCRPRRASGSHRASGLRSGSGLRSAGGCSRRVRVPPPGEVGRLGGACA